MIAAARMNPRVLVAPDSFKGCLESVDVCAALASGVQGRWPEAQVQRLPMADGGEGTLTAVAAGQPGAALETHTVQGPEGEELDAPILWLSGGRVAVIELASVAGLGLVSTGEPSRASTWGVGELIALASAGGAERILIGAGGSGTLDGGAGALQALGFSLLDSSDVPIGPGLLGLETLRTIRAPEHAPAGIEILCDVQSPLLGPHGAARLYGPQKGATVELVGRAETALDRFAALLNGLTGRDPRLERGAGAAGGFAGGMWGAVGAPLRSGIQEIIDLIGLERWIENVDLVITGEGCVDGQTPEGKLVSGMQAMCVSAGVPLAVVAGQVTAGGRAWCDSEGLTLVELSDGQRPVQERIAQVSGLLEIAGRQVVERASGFRQFEEAR